MNRAEKRRQKQAGKARRRQNRKGTQGPPPWASTRVIYVEPSRRHVHVQSGMDFTWPPAWGPLPAAGDLVQVREVGGRTHARVLRGQAALEGEQAMLREELAAVPAPGRRSTIEVGVRRDGEPQGR